MKILSTVVFILYLAIAFTAAEPDLVLNDLGCWKDTADRAVPDRDSFIGGDYTTRTDAIQRCAKYANGMGYSVFAVQNGGWCASGPLARLTYKKYGPSTSCEPDGKGGWAANQVYEINRVYQVNFRYVGCYKDESVHAIPTLEGRFVTLHGKYEARSDPINKCARAAASLGHRVFAIQNGGWCASSTKAARTYDVFGTTATCKNDGEGGPWGNAVYEITSGRMIELTSVGCYKDNSVGAIPALDGTGGFLDGKYEVRANAIEKCARQASSFYYEMMAVQNGGWCASAKDAHKTYDRYGKSFACSSNGEGGPWANQVYSMKITPILYALDLGCWTDDSTRTVKTAEKATSHLSDYYPTRHNAIEKCAQYAHSMGYTHFVVQNGGWCGTQHDAGETYWRLGTSTMCKGDGKGGPWSNRVYQIAGRNPPYSPLSVNGMVIYPYEFRTPKY